jgi:hypothetical protein
MSYYQHGYADDCTGSARVLPQDEMKLNVDGILLFWFLVELYFEFHARIQ